MNDRMIDISDEPARLRVSYEQLVIRGEGRPEVSVPLAEIAALIVSHPRVSYTHAVLAGLAKANAVLVVCDEKRMPAGMSLPMAQNSIQSERIAKQAAAGQPVKKQLWKQIIQAKIKAQAGVLEELRGKDLGLGAIARSVRSGDPENMEAQAARRYWTVLFDDPGFRRDRNADDQNRFLNYGYAVLRASTARAICGAGLNPSMGIHHHNRYDAFPLADDLMEPFRPLVDKAVVLLTQDHGPDAPLDKTTKPQLLEALTGRLNLAGEMRTLFDVLARLASSLAKVFAGDRAKLTLPKC